MKSKANSKAESQAIDTIVTYLTESHLEHHGGYPYDYKWIGDTLVVAGLDDGKARDATELIVLTRNDILTWYKAARAMLPEMEDDMNSALGETTPESIC
jgi:hypothetical protein